MENARRSPEQLQMPSSCLISQNILISIAHIFLLTLLKFKLESVLKSSRFHVEGSIHPKSLWHFYLCHRRSHVTTKQPLSTVWSIRQMIPPRVERPGETIKNCWVLFSYLNFRRRKVSHHLSPRCQECQLFQLISLSIRSGFNSNCPSRLGS